MIVARGPVHIGTSGLAAFLRRDFRLLTREWSVAADIVVTAMLWSLLPVVGATSLALTPETLGRAMFVMLAVGLGHEVGSRSLALERGGLPWSRLLPPGPFGWIRARFAGALLFSLAVFALGAGIASPALHLDFDVTFHCFLMGIIALPHAIAIGLWAGAYFTDPEWVHPKGMLRLNGRLASALLMIVQTSLWLWAGHVAFDTLSVPRGIAVSGVVLMTGALLPALLAGAGSALHRTPYEHH
jgi:hypothetical protein